MFVAAALTAAAHDGHNHPDPVTPKPEHFTLGTEWQGKRIGILGDSMTDPRHTYTEAHYYDYLQQLMGIDPRVYARSGYRWDGIYSKAVEMEKSEGDSLDAILIWAGTNDFNHSIPPGDFFTENLDSVVVNGKMELRRHRTPAMNDSTFCGNINRTMEYLKKHYPSAQIVIMTPIHRAYAKFNEKNIQPDETYANALGLYLDDYVDVLKRAGSVWAVPVIDLHSLSGLYPLEDVYTPWFHNADTDRLHPNALGHYRIGRTIQRSLLALPTP